MNPCQPIFAKQPPTGRGGAHELKYDGYLAVMEIVDEVISIAWTEAEGVVAVGG